MRKTTMILVLVTAMCSLTALAATKKEETAAPNPGVAELRSFVGHWTGTAEMTETGKSPVKVEVTITCHEASGGWAVVCEDRFSSKEMDYRETDLFGYDADTGKVHWYAVTNAGEVHDHVGAWDGAKLAVQYTGHAGGRETVEDITLNREKKNEMAFDGVTKVAGSTVSTMSGTVKRK